jgi:hypothetical protein
MRLWTLHPRYLDAQGLLAAWREALLAQKVLEGATVGYTRHPQLHRFRACRRPVEAIAAFLEGLAVEGHRRGYRFDTSKIGHPKLRQQMDETAGQLLYEWERLRKKLKGRAPAVYRQHRRIAMPEAHPLFRIVPGEIREWERR